MIGIPARARRALELSRRPREDGAPLDIERLGRRTVAPLLAAASMAGCNGDGPLDDASRVRTIAVEVVDFSFRPAAVEARVGDTIRWIQRDAVAHTATSSNPPPEAPAGFDRALGERGDVEEVELERAGRIDYFCRPHPFMTGTVDVSP